jgi:hypothetical protein
MGGTVANNALAHGIKIGVGVVGRPIAFKIVEKGRPIWQQLMDLEVAQRKREAMVDADKGWNVTRQRFDDPFCYSAACPIFARRGGTISMGSVAFSASYARSPFRLAVGV